MARGEKVTFRFFLAKNGFFRMIPVPSTPTLPFDPGISADYHSEAKLFRAVIDQAVHDLGSSTPSVREEAEEWFDPKNEDFCYVCQMALMNPKEIYWVVKQNLDAISKSKRPMNAILEQYKVKSADQLINKLMEEGKTHASRAVL